MKRSALVMVAMAFPLVFTGCANQFLKAKSARSLKNEEFDKSVHIVVPGDEGDAAAAAEPAKPDTEVTPPKPAKAPEKTSAHGRKKRGKVKATVPVEADQARSSVHEPSDVEDGTLFIGRRPKKDPFWIGETVVHDVSYFHLSAGELTMKVEPYGQVNGHKAYNFVTQIKSYPGFSRVYRADDKVVTLVDFDTLVPRVFSLHVKESGQLREARSLFDVEKNEATYWEKKITEKNGEEEKKQHWEMMPYSQNVFSAAFYMRLFPWEIGKEYAFRVADDEQNLVFHGTAIRREVLDTDIGARKAIVVKPQISVKGLFKPTGDILIWLSDDDRKLILRMEFKIKIGTLVSQIIRLDPGKEP